MEKPLVARIIEAPTCFLVYYTKKQVGAFLRLKNMFSHLMTRDSVIDKFPSLNSAQ